MSAIALYQEFETLHGRVGDSWLPKIRELSVSEIKEAADPIRYGMCECK